MAYLNEGGAHSHRIQEGRYRAGAIGEGYYSHHQHAHEGTPAISLTTCDRSVVYNRVIQSHGYIISIALCTSVRRRLSWHPSCPYCRGIPLKPKPSLYQVGHRHFWQVTITFLATEIDPGRLERAVRTEKAGYHAVWKNM
jgi:hypothetical protein